MTKSIYLVGGAVRDELLGLPVAERDWVVVGATVGEMLAEGFRQVDPEFPVFLHPRTGEEYALARREIKAGPGYRGFRIEAGPDVTLEEDLARRDLTINAMARDCEGRLIDLHGGQKDLARGLFRHITPAFVEDPVRILRVARFAARFGAHGFRVAHPTHHLMRQMVEAGAERELQAQRLWREMHKAMASEQPWRFFEVLHACGALAGRLPGLAARMHSGHGRTHGAGVLHAAARLSPDPELRLAATLLTLPETVEDLRERLGLSRRVMALLRQARPLWETLRQGGPDDAAGRERLLGEMGAWRRDGRFEQLLILFQAQPDPPPGLNRLPAAARAGRAVDPDRLRGAGLTGAALGQALRQARAEAVQAAWQGVESGHE